MSLLSDIEAAATTSTEPLADLLRRCKVLAARLKNKVFAEWVGCELNGYESGVDVPPYRIVSSPHSRGHFTGAFGAKASDVPIPTFMIDDEDIRSRLTSVQFRQGVGTLQELAKRDDQLSMPWPTAVIARYQMRFFEDMALVSASILLSPGTIQGVLDTVRTRVLDFVLAIQAENPDAGEAAPSAAAPLPQSVVHNVFNNTIIGGHANIGITGHATIDNSDAHTIVSLPPEKEAELASLLAAARGEAAALPDDEKATALATIEQVAKTAAAKKQFTAENVTKWTTALSGVVTVGTAVAPGIVQLTEWLGALLR